MSVELCSDQIHENIESSKSEAVAGIRSSSFERV